jgi:hypothetical protein
MNNLPPSDIDDLPLWRRVFYLLLLLTVATACTFFVAMELYSVAYGMFDVHGAARRMNKLIMLGAGTFGSIAVYLLWDDFIRSRSLTSRRYGFEKFSNRFDNQG